MSLRTKVYSVLLSVVGLGAAGYIVNEKFQLLGGQSKDGAKGNSSAGQPGGKDAGKPKTEAVPVELATVTKGEISSFISATGNLRALRDVAVATQAEGIVQRVLVEEGDYVKSGQLLCQLDDTQLRIQLELARQRLAQAKLQLEKARIRQQKASVQIDNSRTEYERYKKAHEEGLVSAEEVARRKYTLDEFLHDQQVSSSETKELTHRVAELDAEIAQSELEISRTQIKAPFDGHVTRRTVELGQRVRSLDPLFNLGAFSRLYIDVFLSEREAHQVRPGQLAVVHLGVDAARKVEGRVERISPVVDQATGTVKVTVEVVASNPEFKPGAFVRADLRTDTRAQAVLIPKRALIEEDGDRFVFIANGETASRAKIGVGYETEGMVEIRHGLSAGQKVVVAGQGALKEGAKLRVIGSQG